MAMHGDWERNNEIPPVIERQVSIGDCLVLLQALIYYSHGTSKCFIIYYVICNHIVTEYYKAPMIIVSWIE